MQKKVMAICLRMQFFLANPVYKIMYKIYYFKALTKKFYEYVRKVLKKQKRSR